jgi:lysozyme
MRTSEAGVTLIKAWESRHLTAYLCPAGDPTIGYGHTDGVKMGDRINAYQADQFLRDDLAIAESAIESNVTAPITGTQHAALVSWAFNVGSGAVAKSTLVRLLNQDRYDEVPGQLLRWIKVTDPVTKRKTDSNGLRNRRKAEIALWLTDDTTAPMEAPVPASRPVSPDRASPAASRTLQAAGIGGFATVATAAEAAFSADWRTVAVLALVAVALAVVMRERLKAWAAGWR